MTECYNEAMKLDSLSNYIINKDGTVYSKTSKRLLKPHDRGNGYSQYRMVNDYGNQVAFYAHKLVTLAYLDNPENKLTVNHINRNTYDNRIENLEWATQSEQMIHLYKSGHKANTDKIGKSGLKSGKSRPVTNGSKIYLSITEAEKDGFTGHQISLVCRGLKSQYKKMVWSFVDKETIKC